ncbi:MAG: hypothetical protein JWO53_331 [Chlamydiia bacterium]|nr:hypothetical protein [Chlamydiia bacterium]
MTLHENHFAIIANGKVAHIEDLAPLIKRHQHIIAADGGLHYLHALKIIPELIVGDLDSIDPQSLSHYATIPKEIFSKDKDDSDLALAIDIAFQKGAADITIYAALNGRVDHTLGNLLLLKKRPGSIHIESETETITAISGTHELFCKPGQIVSLFALGDKASHVTTDGLKWELQDQSIDSNFFSLSNICLKNKIIISCETEPILLCLQK